MGTFVSGKVINMIEIKVLALKKKLVNQIPLHTEVSRLDVETIKQNSMGMIPTELTGSRTGTAYCIVVKFNELDYRLVPLYRTLEKLLPPLKRIYIS